MTGIICSMVGASFAVAAAAEVIRKKKGITAVGNAQVDTAQSKFGGSSALFDGTGDRLVVNSSAQFGFSGDFTIEAWVRFTNFTNTPIIFDFRTSSDGAVVKPTLYFSNTGVPTYYTNGSARITGSALSTGTWYHIALSRSSTSTKLFVDGTQVGTTYTDSNNYVESDLHIGEYPGGGFGLNGWVDEFRISKSARYTANFTAPTAAFTNDDNTLLLMHMNGTDASTFFEDDNGVRAQKGIAAIGNAQIDTAQSKFGGSSYLGDGTGDRLDVSHSNSLALGTGDFTIEAWIRITTTAPEFQLLVDSRSGDDGGYCLEIYYGTPRFVQGYNVRITGGSALSTNTWHHIAVSRSGNSHKLFVNGTQSGSTYTASQTYTSVDLLRIGDSFAGTNSLNGHIDEFRISNTARYTANFTAPTEPFVNDDNTLLLLHMDGTDASTVFRDDNGLVPATYTSDVVAFDGTGDYYDATSLSSSVTADSKYALIALNLYWAGGNNLQHPFNIRLGTGSGDYGFWVWINGGRSQLKFVTGTGSVPGSIYENTENSLTANAWNQIVIWVDTTSSTTSQIWVNGNSKAYSNDGFPTGALFNWTNTASTVKIGQKNTSQTSDGNDFNGRISQVYLSAASAFPGIEYFWDKSTNRPKDFGTDGRATGLAQPLIYHYGDASTFPTNRGNFASYSLTANGNVATNAANTIYARARRQRGIIANGNAQIDTAQSKFGGASALFDGTGDYLTMPEYTRSGDFTLEFWVRFNSTSGNQSMVTWGNSTSGTLTVYAGSGGLYVDNYAVGGQNNIFTFSTGTWYHIAIVRSSGNVTTYVDGVSKAGPTAWTTTFGSGTFYIGNRAANDFGLNGWLDELRLSTTARYTANFTAPTAPFQNDANTVLLLHMDGTDASTVFFDDNGRDTTPTA